MTTPSYAELYNALYDAKDYASEATSVLALLGPGVQTVLDVGCGTGRHARAFATHGVNVCGVDSDAAMLAVARSGDDVGPGAITWHDTMSELPSRRFDAAVSLFHVVNYVTERAHLLQFFRDIAQRLPTRRSFVFDVWNGVAALRDPPCLKETTAIWRGRTLRVITTPTLDALRQRVRLDVVIHVPDNKSHAPAYVVRKSYDHRLWTPQELIDAVAEAGLRTRHIGTWAAPKEPARAEDWKLLFQTERA